MKHARLPSPATAVAFVALVAALSGSAVALPGKNRVDSGDIKNGAVRGADVRNNSLTGSDINESRLGKVPSAQSADSATTATTATTATSATRADSATTATNATNAANATNATNAINATNAQDAGSVAGHQLATFSFRVENNGASETFDFHNVRLGGNCVGGEANLDLDEISADSDSRISIHGFAAGAVFGEAEGGFQSHDALPDNEPGSATATVYRGNGEVVTVTYSAQEVPTNACLYYGQATAGPSTTG